ncbi:hypothetical protein [Sphingorhabdus sp. EL138]|uniref:hypothetical protein n=1 Tax=Sphingorhabdus sp. EL138 TaxID=2073156 RepID=UPI0025DF375B|nr:hypothetical protein [Sphingorhabdus sp. EL138]
MTKAVIVGQSHTVCMSAAAAATPGWGQFPVYRVRSGDKLSDPDALSNDQAIDLVRKLNENVDVFLSIPGTYHNILGLVRSRLDFDFFLNPEDRLLDLDYLVPRRVITSAFDMHLETEALVPKLKGVAAGRVYVLACPPPKQDNAFMMQRLLAKWNKPYRGQDIAACGLNRPELRRKLWLIECERTKFWAESMGLDFLHAPHAALNDEGFLAEQYYAEDATHANEDYGLLILKLVASVTNQNKGLLK